MQGKTRLSSSPHAVRPNLAMTLLSDPLGRNDAVLIGSCKFFPFDGFLEGASGIRVHLTPTEGRLLMFLAANRTEWISVAALAHQVWGHRDPMRSDCYKQAIWSLRTKLRATSSDRIASDRKKGYRFLVEQSG